MRVRTHYALGPTHCTTTYHSALTTNHSPPATHSALHCTLHNARCVLRTLPSNPMQPHATPCNPMQPHATPSNPIQPHPTPSPTCTTSITRSTLRITFSASRSRAPLPSSRPIQRFSMMMSCLTFSGVSYRRKASALSSPHPSPLPWDPSHPSPCTPSFPMQPTPLVPHPSACNPLPSRLAPPLAPPPSAPLHPLHAASPRANHGRGVNACDVRRCAGAGDISPSDRTTGPPAPGGYRPPHVCGTRGQASCPLAC